MANRTIAFFDFDGTLTEKDSFIAFLKYDAGFIRFYAGFILLSPILIAYKLHLISNSTAKVAVIKHFWKGRSKTELQNLGSSFASKVIPTMLRPQAIEKLHWHIKENHTVVVVSASFDVYLGPWCELYNIKLIATQAEVIDKQYSGKLKTPNCYGLEKAARIKAEIDIEAYSTIYAYGDSAGDKEMLAIANKPFYKFF